MKNHIEQLRKERSINQETLARAVGVSRQTIFSIEIGKCNPSVMIAIRIARFFGKAVEEVFIDKENISWKQFESISNPNSNKNYKKNIKIPFTDDFIFSQKKYDNIYYGKFPISFNGGEIAAVYNAEKLLGLKPSLSEIILEFEENNLAVLGGFAGTDPKKLALYFAGHNRTFQLFSNENDFKNALENKIGNIFIYSYFDLKCPLDLKGLHTIAGYIDNNSIKAYNINNENDNYTEFKTYKEFSYGKKLIVAYLF